MARKKVHSKPMPRKAGRPKKKIDWQRVDDACYFHCTRDEIAALIGVSKNTLIRACKEEHGVDFGTYFAEKSAPGKESLRKAQFDLARKGNATMLIWLGKNWLNQSDSPTQLNVGGTHQICIVPDIGKPGVTEEKVDSTDGPEDG